MTASIEPAEWQSVLMGALRGAHGPDARLEGWSADTTFTAYGRGRVVRYDLMARLPGVTEPTRLQWLSKFYPRDADARRVAGVLRELATPECAGRGVPAVSQVLAYYAPSHLLLLTYELGESVGDAIAHDNAIVLEAVGQTLAALHASVISAETLNRVTTPADMLDDLRPRIAELATRLPDAAGALQGAAVELETAPPVPVIPAFLHGDFGPTNLLWRGPGERMVALDFDKCTRGDPALDLGNLLAQLRRMTVRVPHKLRDYEAARAHVLAGYRAAADAPEWGGGLERRLAWYERVILIRKAHRLACNTSRHPDAAASPQREAEARRLLLAAVHPAAVAV